MNTSYEAETRKRTLIKIAGLAAVVFLTLFAFYIVSQKLKKSTIHVDTARLEISIVDKGLFKEFIPVVGTVQPINTVYLDAVEGGRVEEIYLEVGSIVKREDRILKLANTNLLLDIMWREAELFQQTNNLRNTRLSMEQYRLQLRQDLANIENQLQQQKRTYDRYSELIKVGLIPKHVFELARDQYEYLLKKRELTIESQTSDLQFRQSQTDALEAQLKRMQDNLEIVKQKQENLMIRAPISGHLTALNAEIGQSKAPGERLGQIDVLEGFRVQAAIDEKYLARVANGKTGELDYGEKFYKLMVKKIYPEVKEGRFEIEMEFETVHPEGIARGQTLQLQLELSGASETVLLPRGGFFQATGGDWIYVVDDSGKLAARRKIKLGRQNHNYFEVLSGLVPGEQAITSSYEGFGNAERLVLR